MVAQILAEPPSETAEIQESSISTWPRWCPTSMPLLHAAERRLFDYIKTPFEARYVKILFTEMKESQIRTLVFNKESKNFPLVLIHGMAAGVGFWCLNADAFASQRPVYAFDLLGFAGSSRPTFSSNALEAESQYVESIEKWRKKMGLQKFILLGHSFGGFIAAAYALQHPDQVAHLILADPWGFPELWKDETSCLQLPFWAKGISYLLLNLLVPFNPLFGVRAAGPFGLRVIQKVRGDLVRKYIGTFEDPNSVVAEYIYHCNVQKPTGESAFHAMMANYVWAKHPMIHRLPALKKDVPITFIYGEKSWIDRKSGDRIKELRENSFVDVHILRGAGHHIYADTSEEFNAIVCKVSDSADKSQTWRDISSVSFSLVAVILSFAINPYYVSQFLLRVLNLHIKNSRLLPRRSFSIKNEF